MDNVSDEDLQNLERINERLQTFSQHEATSTPITVICASWGGPFRKEGWTEGDRSEIISQIKRKRQDL